MNSVTRKFGRGVSRNAGRAAEDARAYRAALARRAFYEARVRQFIQAVGLDENALFNGAHLSSIEDNSSIEKLEVTQRAFLRAERRARRIDVGYGNIAISDIIAEELKSSRHYLEDEVREANYIASQCDMSWDPFAGAPANAHDWGLAYAQADKRDDAYRVAWSFIDNAVYRIVDILLGIK